MLAQDDYPRYQSGPVAVVKFHHFDFARASERGLTCQDERLRHAEKSVQFAAEIAANCSPVWLHAAAVLDRARQNRFWYGWLPDRVAAAEAALEEVKDLRPAI